MTRPQKICIAICALVLAAVGAWLYWETEFPLTHALPDENWTDFQLFIGEPGVGETEWEGTAAVEDLLGAAERAMVTRGPEFPGMTEPYFHLFLIREDGYPTAVTVVKNGQISVAADLDFDNYRYFEDSGKFYEALLAIAESAA